ncbi:spermidine synthase [Anaerobranca californiensis DSM 14826]|uniref:Polyamine aminopropyltransferase n=1 Tax=Anaerobranca californiensis DSM 14826 TaxID=1120989 RepID=A0A1M6NGQ5_9FIRM|nr:polyamine aminopropyltransferase [Anaerobranca californiensis]SHJ94869.1 spermidine synthase [Anaerobranca californiensis DSM 14826]
MELWFTERETDNIKVQWKVNKTLYSKKSPFQQVDIVEFTEFGRALVLDGIIQTTIFDEFIYHEMIAHVPLYIHQKPERVMVVGGGDGGTVREVLKHPTIKQVDLVEIDKEVVESCKKYLPELAGCLADPRVNVYNVDGFKFVEEKEGYYDVIIIDSSDPIGPAIGLFAKPFYQNVYKALKGDGLFTAQTESPLFNSQLIRDVYSGIKEIFPIYYLYTAQVPTYSIGPWTFTLGSKKYKKEDARLYDENMKLRYFNKEIQRSTFDLPQYIKELL